MRGPLEQLERAHRRIEEACEALTVAAGDRDIEAAGDVCSFFARQVRRHEQDEDESLFPRLLVGPRGAEVRPTLERLSGEHRAHAALQARLEDAVAGRFDGDLWGELTVVAGLLTAGYRAHIDDEEGRVFVVAKEILGPDELDAIATEMDARRGR